MKKASGVKSLQIRLSRDLFLQFRTCKNIDQSIIFTSSLYHFYMFLIPFLHTPYTIFTCSLYRFYMFLIPFLHVPYTVFTYSLYHFYILLIPSYMFLIPFLHVPYTLFTYSLYLLPDLIIWLNTAFYVIQMPLLSYKVFIIRAKSSYYDFKQMKGEAPKKYALCIIYSP